jgi:hypothetical protein
MAIGSPKLIRQTVKLHVLWDYENPRHIKNANRPKVWRTRCAAIRYDLVCRIVCNADCVHSRAGLWIISPEFTGTWPRAIFGSVVAVLVVAAASLLTRMRLEFFAGIDRLEAKPNVA